jgi:hypothetical protein
MADSQPTTVFDIPTLNAIGARLFGHANAITNAAADLRLAARIADKLASLRFRIAEIAELALARPEWDRAAFARDLRDVLKDAEDGEPFDDSSGLPESSRASHYSA